MENMKETVSKLLHAAKDRVKTEAKDLKDGLQELSQDIDHEITMIGRGLNDDQRT